MKFQFDKLTWLVLLIFGFSACAPSSDKLENDKDSPADPPIKVVSHEVNEPSLSFPVYEKFSELAPIFQYQNDTTYVINFWATWCKPCIKELPYFEKLHQELQAEKVKVVLVSLDFAKDVDTKLAKFVEKEQLQSAVIALTDGKYNDWIDQVHPDWSGAIPVTYIYKNNKTLFHDQQYDNYEELKSSVEKLVENED